jgi:hypothetical protein
LVSKSDWALVLAAGLAALLFVLPDGDVLGRLNVQRLFPYFIAGYLYAKHQPVLSRGKRAAVALVFGMVFVGLIAFNYNGPTQNPRWYTMSLGAALQTRPLPWLFLLGAVSIYVLSASGVIWAAATYSLLPRSALAAQAVPGRSSLGIYVIHPWLLAASFGTGALGVVIFWAYVVVVSWALALGLERVPVARGLLLGRWKAPPSLGSEITQDSAPGAPL